MKVIGIVTIVTGLSLLFFHGGAYATERLIVFVSVVPQRYFVEKIGGKRVQSIAMVRPGANPATYEPKPMQMVDLAAASVYFAVGAPFERAWLDEIAAVNPRMQIVYTDADIEKQPMTGHAHGPDALHRSDTGKSAQEIPDPHIWLAPPLVKIQAGHIRNGLIAVDPSNRRFYEANAEQFIQELALLDDELHHMFDAQKGRQFMVFHPAWGYFARAYGLEQVPIEIEGKSPKPAELKALIEHARHRDIRVIFAQPQFSTKSAELIAREIGAEVVVADPLAPDWAENLRRVARAVSTALR